MKKINIDRVYPLNRHHNIKILHDLNPLKSFTLSNARLDMHLIRALISQLCLDNSGTSYRIHPTLHKNFNRDIPVDRNLGFSWNS